MFVCYTPAHTLKFSSRIQSSYSVSLICPSLPMQVLLFISDDTFMSPSTFGFTHSASSLHSGSHTQVFQYTQLTHLGSLLHSSSLTQLFYYTLQQQQKQKLSSIHQNAWPPIYNIYVLHFTCRARQVKC